MKSPLRIRCCCLSLCLGALLLLTSACSTKKNTWINRNFHNTTAFYNIYWNGNETYKELLKQVEEKGYDNYSKILHVFEYGSIADTAETSEKTVRMIEKGTKAIRKHSMVIRGVEYVKTIQDAYMMIGIAYFYQHNYSQARTFFNFVSSQFPKDAVKFDAQLWSARTYILENEFEMAASLLAQVGGNAHLLSKKTRRELPMVAADYYLHQGLYDKAKESLKEALRRNKKRDIRNRLNFILAQIHQNNNDLLAAFNLYKGIVRNNATLELDYNARLNMALCVDSKTADVDKIIKSLERLLLDTKNEKYFGRIYYVLSDIAWRDNRQDESLELLQLSVDFSATDRDQLAISATQLADRYFELYNFEKAQVNYKAAVSVMLPDHPDYDRVNTRATRLSELVKYLEIVVYEEDMQRLADLPEGQRLADIDQRIIDYKAQSAQDSANTKKGPSKTSGKSAWYFYNEQAKSFGLNEFNRKWGRRENTDLWFLATKPNLGYSSFEEEEELAQEGETLQEIKTNYTPADREYYLTKIPLKASNREASNKRLEEAKFNLGAGYFDLVEEAHLGIKTLEEFLKQFPGSGYTPKVYHYLYRMNMVLENQAGMKKYRDLLVKEFPSREETLQITDPNYYKNIEINTQKAGSLYEYTFEAYTYGNYPNVLRNTKDAERLYPGNKHMPKFKYLEAMASGMIDGKDGMKEKLDDFVKSYPQEKDLVALAKSTLEFLSSSGNNQDVMDLTDASKPAAPKETEKVEAPKGPDVSMYKEGIALPHYCVIFLSVPEVNTDVVKIKLSDFNRKNFPDDKLSIQGNTYSPELYMIYISTLKTASVAKGYLEELSKSQYVFGGIPIQHRQLLLISSENFSTFLKLKNKDVYEYFFKQYYQP